MLKFSEFISEMIAEQKLITIDVDYYSDNEKESQAGAKKSKVKLKDNNDGTADVTGTAKNLIHWLEATGYDDLEELYPELF